MSEFLDAVIYAHPSRKRIALGLRKLRTKQLENPWNKHDNIPLRGDSMTGEIVTAATILAGSGVSAWVADRLLGPSADALGEHIKLYASERLAAIFGRTKEITDGKVIGTLAPGFAMVVFQRASFSEDCPSITEMWAQLIADAAANQTNRHLLYAEILSQIGSEEALLLQRFALSSSDQFELGGYRSRLVETEIVFGYGKNDAEGKISQILEIDHPPCALIQKIEIPTKEDGVIFSVTRTLESSLCLDILERQRIIERLIIRNDQQPYGPSVHFSVLTALGVDFLRVCRGVDN
jgi:Abortive infection alpha